MGFQDILFPGIRRILITVIVYVILIVFILPYVSTGKPYYNVFNLFSIFVLIYSYILAAFLDKVLGNKGNRKWFFE